MDIVAHTVNGAAKSSQADSPRPATDTSGSTHLELDLYLPARRSQRHSGPQPALLRRSILSQSDVFVGVLRSARSFVLKAVDRSYDYCIFAEIPPDVSAVQCDASRLFSSGNLVGCAELAPSIGWVCNDIAESARLQMFNSRAGLTIGSADPCPHMAQRWSGFVVIQSAHELDSPHFNGAPHMSLVTAYVEGKFKRRNLNEQGAADSPSQ